MGNCSEAGKGGSVKVVGNTKHCMRLVSSGVATWDGVEQRSRSLGFFLVNGNAFLQMREDGLFYDWAQIPSLSSLISYTLQMSVCSKPASPGHRLLLVYSGPDEPWQVWKDQGFVCALQDKMYPMQSLLLGLLPVLQQSRICQAVTQLVINCALCLAVFHRRNTGMLVICWICMLTFADTQDTCSLASKPPCWVQKEIVTPPLDSGSWHFRQNTSLAL